jgi:hypothetical protein
METPLKEKDDLNVHIKGKLFVLTEYCGSDALSIHKMHMRLVVLEETIFLQNKVVQSVGAFSVSSQLI